ncbi:MmgE/PrpD family protein [Celeribacter baekdonensis]|uniref:MmgE/PrpD family protein n=1 Tax=Celeribacter baekdonensis B30 TaxID=1208323 RepID=K2IBK1_9RHOB|nr:MmgE/PrpD family protein [Celeribacter baekdonensis]EKE67251.1 MmgE/PrpD family protein [Celeribacter baekdonensis B30]
MTTAIEQLADLAAGWLDAPISPEVRDAVHCATLDWFATTLPGTLQTPAILLAAGGLARDGNAWCYTSERRIDPRSAAFINAAASHTVEFDDIFRDGGYHPGSPTFAAALAVAQDRGASRDTFDRAVIGGYEVGCRIAMALQPSHYEFWHITGTVGTFGAAAAVAMLLGCDRDGIANAIAIAASFAGGVQQNLQGESMVKAMHPGHAADAGILAAYAAASGATGAWSSLDGPKGYAAATSTGTGNWGAAFDGAGEWTPITRMTVKIHGCCGHIFPALDALATLRAEHGFDPQDIAAIRIEGYGPTKDICDRPDPQVAQEARFSAQYCLAAQMVLGGVRLAAFTPEALINPDIRAIMPCITVERAEDLAAEYPRKRMARLHVTLKDGRSWMHFQPSRRGDPDNPISRADLQAKYEELAGPVLPEAELERLRKTIFDGADLPDAVIKKPTHNT